MSIWHILNIHELANSCSFGLEYYLLGNFEKAKPLLMKGIEFCDMIDKGNFATNRKVIDISYIDAWEDFQILVKCKSHDELTKIVEESVLIKTDLEKMMKHIIYTENKIRNMQRFFNDTSDPYLGMSYRFLKRLENCQNLN